MEFTKMCLNGLPEYYSITHFQNTQREDLKFLKMGKFINVEVLGEWYFSFFLLQFITKSYRGWAL